MKKPTPKPKESRALLRFEVICHIKTLQGDGLPLAECVRAASSRPWPVEGGQYFAARTIETWWYDYANRGLYSLYEDFGFQNRIALLYLVEPGSNLDDESVGRFWPAKLLSALRERKLNWGILTDGSTWRLYSTKSAKPYEDHVELDLAAALQSSDETAYALFERFFHAESFVPVERSDYDEEKSKRLKAAGLKAKKQKRATADDEEQPDADGQTDADKEREAGIYLCRLDLDGEISEAILEARVKEPLLAHPPPGSLYRRGVIMNLTNPKVSLFFLAFLPQFADPARGPIMPQILVLGTLFCLATILVFGAIALFASALARSLPSSKRGAMVLSKAAALVFVAIAVNLVLARIP